MSITSGNIEFKNYFICDPVLLRREVKGADGATGVHSSRRMVGGSAISSAGTSGITTRRTNLRSSSGCGSTQRLSGGNRDHSVTQFALIDDENVSALQQVRNGPSTFDSFRPQLIDSMGPIG